MTQTPLKKNLIVIPARYGSKRFPGKPLHKIAGMTMLQRVHNIAIEAAEGIDNTSVVIATDDERILAHAKAIKAEAIMTDEQCKTGSDRAYAACQAQQTKPDIVINLQGDAPLTPPSFIKALINVLSNDSAFDIATPVTTLSWEALKQLRQQKEQAPFSGTTVITAPDGRALWFSKNIIPAIRNEKQLIAQSPMSPIQRHIGLYGFRFSALAQFVQWQESYYEKLEGLEQLRMLENGLRIKTVTVSYGDLPAMSGVDTIQDAQLAEKLLLTKD